MPATMTERIRLIIDTDDTVRRAVQLRRIKMPRGTTASDVVNEILRGALAEEIAQLGGYPDEGEPARPEPPPAQPKRPRGRPKKNQPEAGQGGVE